MLNGKVAQHLCFLFPVTREVRFVTFYQAALVGFKHKSFRFYGRSSRAEFWYFYLATMLLGGLCALCSLIPIVGALIVAVGVIYLCMCHCTSLVRRLHDLNHAGTWVALPLLLLIAYFVARIPLFALYREHAPLILNLLLAVSACSYVALLVCCGRAGTKGDNRYGTDPLDSSMPQQDFINPEHMQMPEYLGDPWRKIKAKKEQQEREQQEQNTTEPKPTVYKSNTPK